MNIAIIGYGKMGKEIEKTALQRGHKIPLIIDIHNQEDFTAENLQKADTAIEFTTPETAAANYRVCFDANIPVVSGTTGWIDKYNEIAEECKKRSQCFLYASNFSIGVNIFFQINQLLARLMNNFDDYNPEIGEIHHTQKKDAPSGTAITLANQIIEQLDRKTKWTMDAPAVEEIPVKAVRENNVPGIHTITWDSNVDYITIKHSAKSRQGFALGAVLAAEFCKDKKGVFTMNDLLNL